VSCACISGYLRTTSKPTVLVHACKVPLLCMHATVCVCLCVCACVRVFTPVCTGVCVCVCIPVYVFVCLCVCVCMQVYTGVCVCIILSLCIPVVLQNRPGVRVCACICVCVCVCLGGGGVVRGWSGRLDGQRLTNLTLSLSPPPFYLSLSVCPSSQHPSPPPPTIHITAQHTP
jgi:hypothetical protein